MENIDKNAASARDIILANSIGEFNKLLGNMFEFGEEDKAAYEVCYKDVFGENITFSYMSATFFAQFAGELLIGMISSNPFRRFIDHELDEEAKVQPGWTYWEPSMAEKRFGLPDKDYTADMEALMGMMNESYIKIMSLNNWFATPDGKEELAMYCLSKKAVRSIKRAVCQFPYLVRRYDHDRQFAGEIMEYAGIVAAQIRETAANSEEA